MTPKEASRDENENKVWRNLYPEFGGKTLAPKFSIGNRIRLTRKSKTFYKGYTQRWTEKFLKFVRFNLTIPVTYKITYYNEEEIQGSFLRTRTSKDEARHI